MKRSADDRPTSRLSDLLAWVCPFCRKAMRNQADIARVTPQALCADLASGKQIALLDVRHPLDTLGDPRCLPGATRVRPQDLAWGEIDIPVNLPIVVYCAIANEAGSEHAAHLLEHRGYKNIRILDGGFAGWRGAGFPLMDYKLSSEERVRTQQGGCRPAETGGDQETPDPECASKSTR